MCGEGARGRGSQGECCKVRWGAANGGTTERPPPNCQFKLVTPFKALIISSSYRLHLLPGLLPSSNPTPSRRECEVLRAEGLASLGHCSVQGAYKSVQHPGSTP